MAQEFAPMVHPYLAALVPPGDVLRGIVAATQSKTFGGALYGVGVTQWRLVIQQFERKLQPKGGPKAVSSREALAAADLGGAGNGWLTAPSIILSATALRLDVRTDDGEKMKLMMMQGGSTLTGGESQRAGVVALAELLAAARR